MACKLRPIRPYLTAAPPWGKGEGVLMLNFQGFSLGVFGSTHPLRLPGLTHQADEAYRCQCDGILTSQCFVSSIPSISNPFTCSLGPHCEV